MSSIKLESNASGTGIFTIASPNSNTNRTLTLPDSTGTVVVTGGAQTIEFAAGSASTPSITTTGDTNTGMFFPAADTIAFTEGGTESMRIDSSGRVGIGSTSPSTYADSSTSLVIQASSGRSGLTLISNQTVADEILGRISFTDSGSTNAAYRNAMIDGVRGSDDNSAYLTFSTSNSGNPAERGRFTSDGDFFVGTTSNWSGANGKQVIKNSTANEFGLAIQCGDNASQNGYGIGITNDSGANQYYAMLFYYDGLTLSGSGNISVTGSSTAFNTGSDYRLKENIAPMTGALATVTQLKPSTWTWKSTNSAGQGFIAHELAEVVPECVTGEKDAVNDDGKPIYQGVDTSFLVATLTAAIQELKAINDAQATRIEALETKVAALEAK